MIAGMPHEEREQFIIELGWRFYSDQLRFIRICVELRRPVELYLRNEICDLVAAKEAALDGGQGWDSTLEQRQSEKRRSFFAGALENVDKLLEKAPAPERGTNRRRTQQLSTLYVELKQAVELYRAFAKVEGDYDRSDEVRTVADKLIEWWANSLSAFSLSEVMRLMKEHYPEGIQGARVVDRNLWTAFYAIGERLRLQRNCLVAYYSQWARKRAAKMLPRAVEAQRDSDTLDALHEAVDRFTPLMGTAFRGFAIPWIRVRIERGQSQEAAFIREPLHLRNIRAAIRDYIRAQSELNRPASSISVAEILEKVKNPITKGKLTREAYDKAMSLPGLSSLDEPGIAGDDGENEEGLHRSIPDEHADTVGTVEESEIHSRLHSLLERNTSPTERLVLAFKHGVGSQADASLAFLEHIVEKSQESTTQHLHNVRRFPKDFHIARLDVLTGSTAST